MKRGLCFFLSFPLVLIASPFSRADMSVGEKPTLQFTAVDGTKVDLAKLKGKIVIVDFWSLSDAAKEDQCELVQLAKAHTDDGVVLIGICCDRSLTKATSFMKEIGVTWPQYWDGKMWDSPIVEQWDHKDFGPVLIGPDGSVLWVGFYKRLDEQLAQALIATPPTMIDPDELAKANGLLDQVENDLKDHNAMAAFQACAAIPDGATQNKAFAVRMADIQPGLLAAIPPLLAPTDDLIKEHHKLQALNGLKNLLQALKGTLAEKDIQQRVLDLEADPETKAQAAQADNETRGATAIAAARKLRDEEKIGAAYLRLKDIVTDYPGTAAASTAAEMLKTYEQDPRLMEQVNQQIADDAGGKLLNMARAFAAAGKNDEARTRYQQILDEFPNSSQAAAAKQEIQQLK